MRGTKYAVILFLVAIMCVVGSAQAQSGKSGAPAKNIPKMSVNFSFNYEGFPGRIILFEVPRDRILDTADSAVVSMSKPFPFSKRLPDSIRLRRGQQLRFAMVIENNTDEAMFFYPVPHTMKPEENAYGYQLFCFCTQKIMSIPPKSRWYRIGSLVMTEPFTGNSLTISHTVVGITADEIAKNKLKKLVVKQVELK